MQAETKKKPITTMKKILLSIAVLLSVAMGAQAKTIVVYYSYTNHIHTIVSDLLTQIDAAVVRIEPAVEQDYAANNYAIGSAMISAIRNNPDDAASYPAIKPVTVDWTQYDDVIVAVPLWWGNMAAIMQTFLFENGKDMGGKRIGLIVSSASSGIRGVESDAKRLIPDGVHLQPSLWITSSQTSKSHDMVAAWLVQTGLNATTALASAEMQPSVVMQGDMLCVSGDYDEIDVYDLCGNRLISTTENTIDLSACTSGIYVVRIQSGSHAFTHKITRR